MRSSRKLILLIVAMAASGCSKFDERRARGLCEQAYGVDQTKVEICFLDKKKAALGQ